MAFKWYGQQRVAANLRTNVPQRLPSEAEKGLTYLGQKIITEAKKLTPVWNPARPVPPGHTPGSLRASGQAHPVERVGKTLTETLSFGNELVDYAVYVHEDLEAHHATGQAKFLEIPLNEAVPTAAQDIASMIDLKKVVE